MTALTDDNYLSRVLAVLDDDMFAIQIGPLLTCEEADAFADLLRAAGLYEGAEFFLLRHAATDDLDDLDDLHGSMQQYSGRLRPTPPRPPG